VLDGQSAVRTLLNSAVDKTYLHGPRGPEYERTGAGNPTWNLYDGLGSVVGTVNASGTIVSARKFDVYGAVRQLTGSSGTRHKFVGALGHTSEDETGLMYMRARWVDPVLGRFASEDPAQDGTNWFSYCSNNPTGFRDRTGRAGEWAEIPGMPGWEYRIDRWYQAAGSNDMLRDVALRYKGKDMGSFVIGQGRWKHGPHGQIPNGVRSWAHAKFGTILGLSSVVAYMEQNPLDFIAIMLTIHGNFEGALAIDRINGVL
jgi:RHS repeat-associated protein